MRNALLLLCALIFTGPLNAQSAVDPVQVFIERAGDPDRLHFIDLLSGEDTSVEVTGDRYSLFGRGVMFHDTSANRIRLVTPDGRVRSHPFIQPLPTTRRVDWVVSPDGNEVAWTLTAAQADGQLVTTTQIAGIDGSNPREVLTDGPRAAIRALPVAFSSNHDVLYMDYQPDGIGDFTPFQQYAGLFSVDIETGETALLPGEPGCFCGAGLAGGLLLRLDLADDLQGFDVVMTSLAAATSERIPAVRLANYTQAGAMIISADSTQAVYALAQVRDFGGAGQSVRTVFVLVDLVERAQSVLTQPFSSLVRPVGWTEDNTAIVIASADPNVDGTWKMLLDDDRIVKVANATYLGTLR